MDELINISIGNASLVAVLGYCVVFLGLVLLMVVVMVMGKIMTRKTNKAVAESTPAEAAAEAPKGEPAPGSAGDLKLYDTDPKDAAMIMAIVADSLGKPLNELRFISIKEVKDE